MEIRGKRYRELVKAELTLKMINDFVIREKGEISAEAIINHLIWLISVYEGELMNVCAEDLEGK